MISIRRANKEDYRTVIDIALVSVEESHRGSCSPQDLNEYLSKHYNTEAIKAELEDPHNIYHIIYNNEVAAGFSKIILNAIHPNISAKNVTKLDRIYLLNEYFGLRLGRELLHFNLNLAKENGQAGMWLFTWVENRRAIRFYEKTGFNIIGSHKFYVTETHYNDNHQMFLPL